MPSNRRKRYRERRKKAKREERLNLLNEYGIKDTTPYNAVKNIIKSDKRLGESNGT